MKRSQACAASTWFLAMNSDGGEARAIRGLHRPLQTARATARGMDGASTTVGVIGLGYVGLPTAIGFLDAGFEVWGVDISERTVAMVREGRNPTGDPDVDDLVPALRDAPLARHGLHGGSRPAVDVVLVTVPTPVTHDLQPDLSYVESAGRAVFEALPRRHQHGRGARIHGVSAGDRRNVATAPRRARTPAGC